MSLQLDAEHPNWTDRLERDCAGLGPSSLAIGLMTRAEHGTRDGKVLTWRRAEHGFQAEWRTYRGEPDPDLGVLLVGTEDGLRRLQAEGLGVVATLVRTGQLLPYILKSTDELEQAGLMEFIEDLGLVFPKH